MRKIHLLIPSILVASSMPMVSMVGCKKNDAVHVTGVNIEQPTIKSYLGETIHKKAKYAISPDNAADKAITWTVNDPTIATVAEDGTITPLKEGSTTLTITTHDGGYTDDCNLIVEQASPATNPLTFTATKNCNFSVYCSGYYITPEVIPNLHYSKNNDEWADYTMPMVSGEYGEKILLNSGDTIKFYGDNPKGFNYYSFSWEYEFSLVFTSDDEGPCGTVSGNIMSLLSENFESLIEIPSEGCFDSLFCQSGISSAADLILPSDELTKFCYAGMFMGCGSLTQPPELTATILAQGCYQFMFSGCWSLTQPPELWAMDLAPYCYQFMFYDCASLTMAPELPATIIAAGCYFAMFRGCASLKIRQEDTKIEDENFIFTCPTLLTDDDVLWMFEGCTCTGFTSDPQPEKSYYWYTE